MPLSERLAQKEAKNRIMSEATTVFVKDEGPTKEVTYVPKKARKAEDRSELNGDSRSKAQRSRRGVKELGFKTPFKNKR